MYYSTNHAFVKKTVSQFERAGCKDALSFFEPAVSFLLRKAAALRSHSDAEPSRRSSESFSKRQSILTSENESKRIPMAIGIDSVFSYKIHMALNAVNV